MKAELTNISDCKKSLDIEIPQDVVDTHIMDIARNFARKAKVPGFRPGKAPIAVVKSRYREEILSETVQHLLPKFFSDAVQEQALDIVDAPHYDNIDYESGRPLRFKAFFEVYPDLKIANYSGIPASDVTAAVEESEVDTAIQKLQEELSELAPVEEEREVKEGDYTEISFHGEFQGSDQEPIAADKAVVEIGGKSTLKEFTDNLLGSKVGEERIFTVTYRTDYPEERLAAKTVQYTVKVDTLKEKKIPELNDEFAQGVGDYKTLAELRAKARQDLEKHKREHANEEIRENLLKWLEDNNTFEVPDVLVDRQIQTRMQRLVRDLARQGINPQRLDVDWGKIREDQKQQAIRDVKGSLILEYVADQEKFEVSDDEVAAEIDRIAQETNRSPDKVREVFGADAGMNRLRGQIRNKKTLDFLQQHASFQQAAPAE